ncbi:centriolar and ciliogenesis-associated protein HYLS1 [Pelodytes ibericus]
MSMNEPEMENGLYTHHPYVPLSILEQFYCIPVELSEEDLQKELSLLGYTHVPRHRILQFKEDLMSLMKKGQEDESQASGRENRAVIKQSVPSTFKEPESSWNHLSAWPAPSSSSSHPVPGGHIVSVGGPWLGAQKAQPLTRKVLRKKSDGQMHVSDESLVSSETEQEESQISAEDLSADSCFRHSSQCTKSFIRPPPFSLLDQYRQRSDPVGRYQEYKQSWDAHQGALVQSRKDLRWGVREQMMSALPQCPPRPLPTPNSYVVPTDKKRYGLRWSVRKDLVNGIVPRTSFS